MTPFLPARRPPWALAPPAELLPAETMFCLPRFAVRVIEGGAQIRVPRAARAAMLTACRLFRLSHPRQRLIRCLLPSSGNAGSDSRHDEQSIGTWPPLCYVATCEAGPTWKRIAYAKSSIANLSA